MVTKVFNIQPVLFFCELNFVTGIPFFAQSWCHALQEKIMVCFAYIYTPFTL